MAKSLPCALVFAALLFACGPSHAKELTYEQFDRLRETDSAKGYIIGIAEGISWTNIAGEVMYGKRVYCTPKDLIITNSQSLSILDNFVAESGPERRNDFVGQLLLEALHKVFPCQQ